MQFRQLLPLVFLALMLPSITAVPSCGDILVNTSTVRVARNSEVTEYFIIDNKGNERFFVDSTEVFDNTNGLIASESGFDRVIDASGFGMAGVKVRALNDAIIGHATGLLRVRGHFLSGRECSFQEIGTKQFGIVVEEQKAVTPTVGIAFRACEGIIIANPVDFIIDGKEMALRINNGTSFRITVKMSGNGLTVNPHAISIPSLSDVTEIIKIEGDKPETLLVYSIESPVCNGLDATRITRQGTQAQEAVAKEKPLSERVEMSIEIKPKGFDYSAIVSLENKGNDSVSGEIELSLPRDWSASGNTRFLIAPKEKTTREFIITPKEPFAEAVVKITLKSGQEKILKEVRVPARQTEKRTISPLSTALAGLGQSPLLPAIVFAVIALLAWLFVQGRKRIMIDRQHKLLIRQ